MDFLESNAKQVLIDIQNGWYDNCDREILFDEHVIEIQTTFDEFPVVVSIVPDIEFAVEWQAKFFMFLLFQCEKGFSIL